MEPCGEGKETQVEPKKGFPRVDNAASFKV